MKSRCGPDSWCPRWLLCLSSPLVSEFMPKSNLPHAPSLNDDTKSSVCLQTCCCVQVARSVISNCGQTLSLQAEGLHLRLLVRRGAKNVQEISCFLKISSTSIGDWARTEAKVYFLEMCAGWNDDSTNAMYFGIYMKIKPLHWALLTQSPLSPLREKLQNGYESEKRSRR